MKVITRRGTVTHIDANDLSEAEKGFAYTEAVIVNDDLKLTDYWIAVVLKRAVDADPRSEYEIVVEQGFYHEPTEDELIYLLISNDVFGGYVSVHKCKCLKEWLPF